MNSVPLVGLAFGWSLLHVVVYVWLEGVALALATTARLAARGGAPGAVLAPFYLVGAALALAFQALLLTLAFFVMRFQREGLFAVVDDGRAALEGLAWGAGAVLAWHARDPRRPAWRIAAAPTAHLAALGVFSVVAVYVMRDVAAPALALAALIAMKTAIDAGVYLLSERYQASSGIL